jgi:TctA family transporter
MAGLVLLSGIYSLNFSIIDLGLLIGFALLGILLTQANISPMTVIIGFTLGTQIEDRFVKSLIISDGDYTKFIFNHALLFVIVVSSIYYLISKLTNPTPGHVSQE